MSESSIQHKPFELVLVKLQMRAFSAIAFIGVFGQ